MKKVIIHYVGEVLELKVEDKEFVGLDNFLQSTIREHPVKIGNVQYRLFRENVNFYSVENIWKLLYLRP